MDELAKRRKHKRTVDRRDGIDTILDDLTIARGTVEEMLAEARQHHLDECVVWLVKADDALTATVAAAERAK